MLDLRSQYVIPENAIELRAFTHGAMPRSVPAMMQHFTDDWMRLGVDAWNEVPNHWLPKSGEHVGWWSLPEYLGDRFVAPLIGAAAGTCIMQPNLHWSVNCLLSDVERFRGRRVVITDDAFPSVLQSARKWSDVAGFDLQIVPSDRFIDRKAVLEAIDSNCALVMLNHVSFTTGERLSESFLSHAADRAHRHGALLAVDGYHAVATMPIRVSELGIDVYMGGLLKEGSGSAGTAFVYVRPGLELNPLLTGWFGHDDPFAFAHDALPHTDIRRRFLGGTTAIASLYHSVEGARILLSVGLDEVRKDSLAKTAYCLTRADEIDVEVRSPRPPEERGSMVVLGVDRANLLSVYLKRFGVYTDSRLGRYLRLAPFVWNMMDELERTFEVLVDALTSREYLNATKPDGPVV